MADTGLKWQVRAPLRWGSRHVSSHETEAEALAVAKKLAADEHPHSELLTDRMSRVIYIHDLDD
jgi:hypothetical protein